MAPRRGIKSCLHCSGMRRCLHLCACDKSPRNKQTTTCVFCAAVILALVCVVAVLIILTGGCVIDHGNWLFSSERQGYLTVVLKQNFSKFRSSQQHKRSDDKFSCRFHSCFDIGSCEYNSLGRIGVYVYPPIRFVREGNHGNHRSTTTPATTASTVIVTKLSVEYEQVLDAIRGSPYNQPNASRACVFVPSLDTLNQNSLEDVPLVSSMLQSLPYWRNKGQNHLIFNMLPGSHPTYNTSPDFDYGQAMLAGGGVWLPEHRMGFDVGIPVYNPLIRPGVVPVTRPYMKRKYFLTVLFQDLMPDVYQALHKAAAASPENRRVVLLDFCQRTALPREQLLWKRCSRSGDVQYNYPIILQKSEFCFVVPGKRFGSPDFTDALMSGCIPVLLGDHHVLPFSEVIDWPRASVTLWSHDLESITDRLGRFSKAAVREMREQVLYLYQRYFSSMATIALTTLDIINDRVFPTAAKSYEYWNNKPIAGIGQLSSYTPRGVDLPPPSQGEGFTVVVLTYNRLNLLYEVIRSVAKAPSLAKVLVVWNDYERAPPPASEWPNISKPVQVIRSKENKLTNRFLPYPEIETAAVFSLDDDITMLTSDEIEFGYKAWLEFPRQLVGFPGRVHVYDEMDGSYKYDSTWLNNVSIVLTGAAFYHKFYHHLFTYETPREVRDWIDSHVNCEDLTMNFVIANYTHLPALKVTPKKKFFKCPDCNLNESLWQDIDHYKERNQCLNILRRFYGNVPLKTVKFRLDPLLYLDPRVTTGVTGVDGAANNVSNSNKGGYDHAPQSIGHTPQSFETAGGSQSDRMDVGGEGEKPMFPDIGEM